MMKHTINSALVCLRSNVVVAGMAGESLLDFFKETNDDIFP
jgi:hypothetical protein